MAWPQAGRRRPILPDPTGKRYDKGAIVPRRSVFAGRLTALDPERAIKIGVTNGREARESGLLLTVGPVLDAG